MSKTAGWILMLLLLTGITARAQSSATVGGTVTYRERIALPEAEVIVRLVDVSRADAPATTLATQTIATNGAQVPFPFSLSYDPAAIDQRNSYAVQAEIRVDGQRRFINTQNYGVITQGNPTTVDLVLEAVSDTESAETPATLPATDGATDPVAALVVLALALLASGAAFSTRGGHARGC